MITIYGTSQCSSCKSAIHLAERYGLDFIFKDVGRNAFFEELKSKNVDMTIVPHIWWGDRYVGTYKDFLDESFVVYSAQHY